MQEPSEAIFETAVMTAMATRCVGGSPWEKHRRFLWECYQAALKPVSTDQIESAVVVARFTQYCRFDDLRTLAGAMLVRLKNRATVLTLVWPNDGSAA